MIQNRTYSTVIGYAHSTGGLVLLNWVMAHGDDFVSEGPFGNFKKMDKRLSEHFDIKTEILGPEPE